MTPTPAEPIRLFLCGDVMTGRGIDQVLPHPGDPVLSEPCARDARDYVRLAEKVSGPIPAPVDGAYLWGDALAELERAGGGTDRQPGNQHHLQRGPLARQGSPLPHAPAEHRLPGGRLASPAAAWPTTTCSTGATGGW